MIVADSSVWVAYLRADGTDAHQRFVQLRDEAADLAVTEMLVLEVLAGARDEPHRAQLRDQLLAFPLLTLDGLDAFEEAARIFQTCRRGETPRKLTDCLIAVPCIRAEALLVHADRDFEVIARCTTLRTESLLR